jgi:hypothetical protein
MPGSLVVTLGQQTGMKKGDAVTKKKAQEKEQGTIKPLISWEEFVAMQPPGVDLRTGRKKKVVPAKLRRPAGMEKPAPKLRRPK